MTPIIQDIPLSEFDLSLSGMRIMNMTRILQVEKSMRLHGQLQPVVARVHANGIQLIDGFKRLYCAEDLMMETLQCHLLEIGRRLSLIGKMDQGVSTEILMGTLTSSHARALIKLPRGKQKEVARVIATWRLSSRQSDILVETYLKAKDEDHQRYILENPEKILMSDPADSEEEPYDVRLSFYYTKQNQSAYERILVPN